MQWGLTTVLTPCFARILETFSVTFSMYGKRLVSFLAYSFLYEVRKQLSCVKIVILLFNMVYF